MADLFDADLSNADLVEAYLTETFLTFANLNNANLNSARLQSVQLGGASLIGANLRGAKLVGTNLGGADLSGADLSGADLRNTSFVGTNLTNAKLQDCNIYGISAWNVQLDGAIQLNLTITPEDEPAYEDLSPYFADLSTLSRLSAQEEATLLSYLRLAQQGLLSPEQARVVKQRLIEGCLPRDIRLAKDQQSHFHRFSFADLIQEGNLGLLQAVEDFDFSNPQSNFFAYATACIRNAITRLLPRDGLLSIHRLQFWKLAEQGRLKEWDHSQPLSLDVTNEQDASLYDVLPTCSAVTPMASDSVHLHVETLLARLTAHERTVLRLCYGLDESDGRTLSRTEIAALLGITSGAVKGTISRALRKLRAAPQEVAAVEERRKNEAEKHAQHQARRAEQEANLEEAYARLEAQGCPITMLRLAQEAQVGTTPANAYLRRRWGTIPQRLRQET